MFENHYKLDKPTWFHIRSSVRQRTKFFSLVHYIYWYDRSEWSSESQPLLYGMVYVTSHMLHLFIVKYRSPTLLILHSIFSLCNTQWSLSLAPGHGSALRHQHPLAWSGNTMRWYGPLAEPGSRNYLPMTRRFLFTLYTYARLIIIVGFLNKAPIDINPLPFQTKIIEFQPHIYIPYCAHCSQYHS